jgi:hypothetical protein
VGAYLDELEGGRVAGGSRCGYSGGRECIRNEVYRGAPFGARDDSRRDGYCMRELACRRCCCCCEHRAIRPRSALHSLSLSRSMVQTGTALLSRRRVAVAAPSRSRTARSAAELTSILVSKIERRALVGHAADVAHLGAEIAECGLVAVGGVTEQV